MANAVSNIFSNDIGHEMYNLIAELFPICRSITGNGFRTTLEIIKNIIPLEIYEIPSGTSIYDWTVPKEWNIKDAYIKNRAGKKIIDFSNSNLHVLNYSIPVNKKVSLTELREHLFTLPEHPDWIPYRTSYYKENWGFCLSHKQFLGLVEQEYEVCIDSTLEDGYLTYGEYYIQGDTDDEILLSCHSCHPSLCNDNLSGMALATFLARYMQGLSIRYSIRFLFIPGTIGSIAWLFKNESVVKHIKHGLVVACVGDRGKFTYKKSRRGNAEIDIVVSHYLKNTGAEHEIMEFSPYGYDERQFCSPGFNLPIGCLMRTPHGRFPEYHTSADNLDFVKPEYLEESFTTYLSIVLMLESNKKYINLNPKCEPQLGRRGLYRSLGGQNTESFNEMPLLWVLNLSDGENSLLDIANRSGFPFHVIKSAADSLIQVDLLKEYFV